MRWATITLWVVVASKSPLVVVSILGIVAIGSLALVGVHALSSRSENQQFSEYSYGFRHGLPWFTIRRGIDCCINCGLLNRNPDRRSMDERG